MGRGAGKVASREQKVPFHHNGFIFKEAGYPAFSIEYRASSVEYPVRQRIRIPANHGQNPPSATQIGGSAADRKPVNQVLMS
jgi:hypothetical protein